MFPKFIIFSKSINSIIIYINPRIFAFLISLVNFFCLPLDTEVILEEKILLFSDIYFFNTLIFL